MVPKVCLCDAMYGWCNLKIGLFAATSDFCFGCMMVLLSVAFAMCMYVYDLRYLKGPI